MTVSKPFSLIFSLITSSLLTLPARSSAQQIVDPCFASVNPIGRFESSEDIINVCKCEDANQSADLIEWDGTKWLGTLTDLIDLTPPEGCNIRAMWVGYQYWTRNGEAFAMRLDKPLEAGKTYSY